MLKCGHYEEVKTLKVEICINTEEGGYRKNCLKRMKLSNHWSVNRLCRDFVGFLEVLLSAF